MEYHARHALQASRLGDPVRRARDPAVPSHACCCLGLQRELHIKTPHLFRSRGESLQLRLAATRPSLQQLLTSYGEIRHPPEKFPGDGGGASNGFMSVGSKSFPTRRERGEGEAVVGGENGGGAVVREESKGGGGRNRTKQEARYGRCFSGLELSIGQGPLRDMDAGRLKGQIRRWAKAVVAYARQLSFGSPRSSRSRSRSASSPTSGADDTPRSATFQASKSGRLSGAKNDEPSTPT